MRKVGSPVTRARNEITHCDSGVSIEHGQGNLVEQNVFRNDRLGVHFWWDDDQDKRVPMAGGKAFPGFEWRSSPELNINAIWLYRYMSQPESNKSLVWWDHVVIAKKYIRPITPK